MTQTVFMPALDQPVSRLGFGCSSIMGRVGRRASLDALALAFDEGVNYFDVARSYGYGRAEAIVGEFLQGRRSACVIATKVGIEPSLPSWTSRLMLPLARGIASKFPMLKKLTSQRGENLSGVSKGHFDALHVRQSLETSLRELSTDYVDILLLHEIAASEFRDEELRRCLEEMLQSGKVRALGIATGVAESLNILADAPEISVTQMPSRITDPCPEISADGRPFLVTHSAMGLDAFERTAVLEALKREKGILDDLVESGLYGKGAEDTLSELLLAWSLAANPNGLTLSGMLKREHVLGNLSALHRMDGCGEALLALGAACRSE